MIKIYIPLLLILSINTLAQTGSINGRVTTHDGKPAPYVSVIVKGEKKGVITNDQGLFILKHVKTGNYILITSFVGLQSQEKNVIVIADQSTSVDFSLQESAEQLAEVEIKEARGHNEQTLAVGKIAIGPMDLPQSTMVIDHAVLERQQVSQIGDVIMNTNGLYIMGTTGGTQQEIAGRGFAYTSNNTFKNGVRFNNGVMPEMSSLQRVEILKGSAAILFGQVGAGGVLNLITKKPKFQKGGELSFRTGSYNLYKPTLDFYGSVNNSEHVAYRINASYENAGSFRDQIKSDRIYFNPSFLIKVGKKSEVIMEGDYLKDNRTLDYGIVAINYEIANTPRSRFLGSSWAYYKAEQKSATLTVKHQINNAWQLQVIGSYQGYAQDQYGTTRPNNVLVSATDMGTVKDDGTWIRGLQRSGVEQQYYIAQADLTGKFKTGSVEHTLLVGAEVDKYATSTLAYTYRNTNKQNVYDTINVFDLNAYKQRNDIPEIPLSSITKNPVNRAGIYVQDMISVSEKIKALAGIRYSYIDNVSTVFSTTSQGVVAGDPVKASPGAFSPRLGLVYQPVKQISIFSSYSNSFDINTGTDNKGKALSPSLINQYEAGIKNELFKGLLSANITLYKIVNSNFAQTILTTSSNYTATFPAAKELAGVVTSNGFEVDIMSKSYQGASIIAGYSYNDTRYTKSNVYIENSRMRYNPQHTANLSIYYTFEQSKLNGFNVGFTSLYVGDRVAGRSSRTTVANDNYKLMTIPNYVQFDISAGYTRNNISLRLKVSNLFNELSYNIHDDNSVNPIAPRQFLTTLSYKF